MRILGINAYHGGASACLIRDGKLVAAAEEERFNRIKYWAGFPVESVKYVLSEANITPADLDHIGISRDPNPPAKTTPFTKASSSSGQWSVVSGQLKKATIRFAFH